MNTSDLKLKLNEDGTLSIPAGTLTTKEVEELLLQLAQARYQMEPAVEKNCPEDTWAATGGVRIGLGHQLSEDGFVVLALRHPGFGWLTFEILQSDARTIASHITSLVGDTPFLDTDRGDGFVS
ncbi:hypothetical protein BLA17378_03752 [Burkholderia aenigmatica]|uniref:Uncharacterized protein n=1 Tax=Burkholderia aenigmatica TaxID=2015348 RepID=A0ABY6XTD3_9BURK|nr:hypothetical protein [Burkholderia aenigmatica]VWC78598.1 hypothetical protein BLA17378_03752 [Burkholderia aenigmatica]